MIVWVLTDDKVGSNNQSIAVAENLSMYYKIKKIVYNSFIKLPNFIRKDTLIGINKSLSDDIMEDLPDIVISSGRRLSSVALNIKKRSGGKTFIINIMNPDMSFDKFDLVLLPKHDKISRKLLKSGNIIETNGSINRINSIKIKEESNKWKEFFNDYNRPLISLAIGGDTKNYKIDPEHFGKTIDNLSKIVNRIGGTLLITTSRRTSNDCLIKIREKVDCDYYLYDWRLENTENNEQKSNLGNPYYAFLGLSDFLIVTGDSMSMISECCSTGKPVYVYMPKEILGKKHMIFCQDMLRDGYIKEFKRTTSKLEKYEYKPLNETKRIVEIIYKKLEEYK